MSQLLRRARHRRPGQPSVDEILFAIVAGLGASLAGLAVAVLVVMHR